MGEINKIPDVRNKINIQLNIDKLKQDIKIQQAEKVWNRIFQPDPNLGKLGILESWKRKYLFPFGDLAPQDNYDKSAIDHYIRYLNSQS